MPKNEKRAAVLTIKEAGRMSYECRKDIAAWLRRQASMFVREGDKYTKGRFTARYLYR